MGVADLLARAEGVGRALQSLLADPDCDLEQVATLAAERGQMLAAASERFSALSDRERQQLAPQLAVLNAQQSALVAAGIARCEQVLEHLSGLFEAVARLQGFREQTRNQGRGRLLDRRL